ncbi:MAG TPA: LuxR C-terminal-related transcriptional regulator [Myxococcaceae bacterium]|nr:LuxR C-terminal-related transcriptional regulator [Myxococcaceae bacterium]
MGASAFNLLDIIDVAYMVDMQDAQWLRELALAARPHLDQGFGVAAFEYIKPEGAQPRIVQRFHLGIPDELEAIYGTVFAKMDPAIRLRPFRLGPCITGSELMGMRQQFRNEPHMKKFVQRFGMFDSIWITAAEPSGRGLGFHAGRPQIGWASPTLKKRWGRVAAHLATAVRLRHALRAGDSRHADGASEAVLDPKGRVHDASGTARTPAARESLRRAVLALEASRGSLLKADPDASLEVRKALVSGHWSLLDRVELDGRRYIVARENPPGAPGPEVLSVRERQVLAYAKLGHHNKLIAYELGIAYSTVRVLLTRAAAKLGVRSRRDLLRVFDDGWCPPPNKPSGKK